MSVKTFLQTWRFCDVFNYSRDQSPILIEYGKPLFVWLSREWPSVRTYSSTGCTGRVGQTIKRKGGVSQACLGKSTSFTLDIHNIIIWSTDSCQNRISTDQYHMTISQAHVSTHRGHVIYLEAVRWPVNCIAGSGVDPSKSSIFWSYPLTSC